MRLITSVFATLAAFSLSGCAITQPPPSPTQADTAAPGPASPSDDTPAAVRLVLSATAVGNQQIGSALNESVATAVNTHLRQIGRQSEVHCYGAGDQYYWIEWDGLKLKFDSEALLRGWELEVATAPAGVSVDSELPLDATYAEVEAKYPQAVQTEPRTGQWVLYDQPTKLGYQWNTGERPQPDDHATTVIGPKWGTCTK